MTFKQFLIQENRETISDMFSFVYDFLPFLKRNNVAPLFINGSVESYAGDRLNVKTEHRGDVLSYSIPRAIAEKNGIFEGKIDEKMAKTIEGFLIKNPKYSSGRYAPYTDLFELFVNIISPLRNKFDGKWLIWALKHIKFFFLLYLRDSITLEARHLHGKDESDYEKLSKAGNRVRNLIKSIKLDGKETYEVFLSNYELIDVTNVYGKIYTNLNHFLSLNIPRINNYDPGSKCLSDVITDLEQIEEEYFISKGTDKKAELPASAQKIIQLKDGFAWYNLGVEVCRNEGDAMGHCGNAGFREGDRVLSLRSNDTTPHLTFILHSDGSLGESKGYKNSKPSKKYHSHIISLLAHSINGKFLISRIEGGGYKPENNFYVSDLSEKDLYILNRVRPDLVETNL